MILNASVLFVAISFLNAYLLFLVQPLVAKMILPKLGGAPVVWNTCNLFFQSTLLAGYVYANWLTKSFKPLVQLRIHFVLLTVPFLFLPIAIPAVWEPNILDRPWLDLLVLLFQRMSIPFFVISTLAPLLQRWMSLTDLREGKDPYFLYAASNAGSLIALLGYPLWIEPVWSIEEQSRLWLFMYAACGGLLTVGMVVISFHMKKKLSLPVQGEKAQTESISMSMKGLWVLLAFVPSSLFLGVTTHISSDIAAVPMIWVLPLSIYLLTFILAFSRKRIFAQGWLLWIYPFIVLPLAITLGYAVVLSASIMTAWHLTALFVVCLICHQRLSDCRPSTDQLTEFYLWISVGGVLGGLFNAILAPLLFKFNLEYPLTLFLACWLATSRETSDGNLREKSFPFRVSALLVIVAVLLYGGSYYGVKAGAQNVPALYLPFILFPILIVFSFRNHSKRFAVGVAIILFVGYLMNYRVFMSKEMGRLLFHERSFFGIYKVENVFKERGNYHVFFHGSTIHGSQSRAEDRQCEALTYFSPGGPIGEVFSFFNSSKPEGTVGIVGLGSGSLAGYALKTQKWTFFEIDPMVLKIAETPELFSYLKQCIDSYQSYLGDARLALKRIPDQTYDLLFLDAFSSDSVPIHLLTKEALQLYLNKLKPGGILVFNVTNRYLRFQPLFRELAKDLGLFGLTRLDRFNLDTRELDPSRFPSEWVVLARRAEDLGPLAANPEWQSLENFAKHGIRAWTDDYSNIFRLFRWK